VRRLLVDPFGVLDHGAGTHDDLACLVTGVRVTPGAGYSSTVASGVDESSSGRMSIP
jgi:accessory colonization factor AcfC